MDLERLRKAQYLQCKLKPVDHRVGVIQLFDPAHGDAFELLEFTEEALDEVSPFLYFGVNGAPWV
jgi:hypothetical protein